MGLDTPKRDSDRGMHCGGLFWT